MFNKVDEVIGLLFFKGILFLTKSQMVSNWSRSPPKMSMFRSQTSVAGLLRHGPERFGYLNGFENTNENDCEWIRIMKWRYSLESMDLHPSKHPYSCIAHDVYIYTYIYTSTFIHYIQLHVSKSFRNEKILFEPFPGCLRRLRPLLFCLSGRLWRRPGVSSKVQCRRHLPLVRNIMEHHYKIPHLISLRS